jgi:hypothetical protein
MQHRYFSTIFCFSLKGQVSVIALLLFALVQCVLAGSANTPSVRGRRLVWQARRGDGEQDHRRHQEPLGDGARLVELRRPAVACGSFLRPLLTRQDKIAICKSSSLL